MGSFYIIDFIRAVRVCDETEGRRVFGERHFTEENLQPTRQNLPIWRGNRGDISIWENTPTQVTLNYPSRFVILTFPKAKDQEYPDVSMVVSEEECSYWLRAEVEDYDRIALSGIKFSVRSMEIGFVDEADYMEFMLGR